MRYIVTYMGKYFTYHACNTFDAMKKFTACKVFENKIPDWAIGLFDSDTYGMIWGDFKTDTGDIVSIESAPCN